MTLSYEARYALPPALLLTVPAAVGAEALARRIVSRRDPAGPAERIVSDEPAAARRGAAA